MNKLFIPIFALVIIIFYNCGFFANKQEVAPIIIEQGSKIPYTYMGKFELTHYTHTGNRTASGHYPTLKTVAVDTNIIPMGSLLYIEGYGLRVAMDTGGLIKGNKLDIFVDSHDEAIQKGLKKDIKVYLIEDK